MNEKFLKRLKYFCKVRKVSYEVWLKAYKAMPSDTQKKFKADLLKDIKLRRVMAKEREEAIQKERFTRKSFHG